MNKSIKIYIVPSILFLVKSVKGSVSVGANVGLSNLLFKASSKVQNYNKMYTKHTFDKNFEVEAFNSNRF